MMAADGIVSMNGEFILEIWGMLSSADAGSEDEG